MTFSGLQKLSLLDYPGRLCATVFAAGCNLRCPFCHNASLLRGGGQTIDTAEILRFLRKRVGTLDALCITGGEPTLQNTADLIAFITEVKSMGYLVKLDTNGTCPQAIETLLPLIDYVAMDIKAAPENYPRAVGIERFGLAPIERSVELIKNSAADYELRTTYVGGLHTLSDAEGIGRWLTGAKRYRIQNYRESGDILSPNGLRPMTAAELAEIKKTTARYIADVQIRG